jgi:hypothetical protein
MKRITIPDNKKHNDIEKSNQPPKYSSVNVLIIAIELNTSPPVKKGIVIKLHILFFLRYSIIWRVSHIKHIKKGTKYNRIIYRD